MASAELYWGSEVSAVAAEDHAAERAAKGSWRAFERRALAEGRAGGVEVALVAGIAEAVVTAGLWALEKGRAVVEVQTAAVAPDLASVLRPPQDSSSSCSQQPPWPC